MCVYNNEFINKPLNEVIKMIYKMDELKLNNNFKLEDKDEYVYLMNELINKDVNYLNIENNIFTIYFSEKIKGKISLKDLIDFLIICKSIINNNNLIVPISHIYADPFYFNKLELKNINCNKWKLKYFTFAIKILKLFDVPIFENDSIDLYINNKYNYEQRKYFLENDFNEIGTYENQNIVVIQYFEYLKLKYNNLIENDCFPFFSFKKQIKYNNLFFNE
jgi:hypothetical protein